jgi:hypothetical protein
VDRFQNARIDIGRLEDSRRKLRTGGRLNMYTRLNVCLGSIPQEQLKARQRTAARHQFKHELRKDFSKRFDLRCRFHLCFVSLNDRLVRRHLGPSVSRKCWAHARDPIARRLHRLSVGIQRLCSFQRYVFCAVAHFLQLRTNSLLIHGGKILEVNHDASNLCVTILT